MKGYILEKTKKKSLKNKKLKTKSLKNKKSKTNNQVSIYPFNNLLKKNDIKIVTVSCLKDFKPLPNGISYTVQHKNNGDLFKKYINGVLVKKKIITDYKLNNFSTFDGVNC